MKTASYIDFFLIKTKNTVIKYNSNEYFKNLCAADIFLIGVDMKK